MTCSPTRRSRASRAGRRRATSSSWRKFRRATPARSSAASWLSGRRLSWLRRRDRRAAFEPRLPRLPPLPRLFVVGDRREVVILAVARFLVVVLAIAAVAVVVADFPRGTAPLVVEGAEGARSS